MEKRKIGIYCIRNKVNGRRYVGQSDNIYARWEQHKIALMKGRGNDKLQKDWDKYGEENFEFFILEETDYFQFELDKKESYYAYKYDVWEKGYNVAKLLDYSCISDDEIKSYKIKLFNVLSKQKSGRYSFNSLSEILNLSNSQLAILCKSILQEEMISHNVYFKINLNYSYDSRLTTIKLMTWFEYMEFMDNSIRNISY